MLCVPRFFFCSGLFIIDQRGILRQITMNDLPVGRSVDETLRLVQAFQYTDSHGEVCPAGWKPGADTVSGKCDPDQLKIIILFYRFSPCATDRSQSHGEDEVLQAQQLKRLRRSSTRVYI